MMKKNTDSGSTATLQGRVNLGRVLVKLRIKSSPLAAIQVNYSYIFVTLLQFIYYFNSIQFNIIFIIQINFVLILFN